MATTLEDQLKKEGIPKGLSKKDEDEILGKGKNAKNNWLLDGAIATAVGGAGTALYIADAPNLNLIDANLSGNNSIDSITQAAGFYDIPINLPAYLAGAALSNKLQGKHFTSKDLREEAIVGTAVMFPIKYAWQLMNQYMPIVKNYALSMRNSAAENLANAYHLVADNALRLVTNTAVFLPTLVGINMVVDYIVKNKKVKGLYTYLANNWYTNAKSVFLKVGWMVAANALFVPAGLNIAVGAGITFAYSVYNALAGKRKEEKDRKEKHEKEKNSAAYNLQNDYLPNNAGNLLPQVA
ncbi:TPA: hypothetical protein HA246_06015 [Candidatus Woesearchaeota archaeon]|nr:hypothetical protein [Candidatus Woesearchaeota archaeon]